MNKMEFDGDLLALDFLQQSGVAQSLALPGVTEVAINRPYEIWLETGDGWARRSAPELDLDLCQQLANTLCTFNHRYLSASDPIKTVQLPGRERCQIVIPPACEKGTVSMTFRKPSLSRFTLDDYLNSGRLAGAKSVSQRQQTLLPYQLELKAAHQAGDWRLFFQLAVKYRLNIIIFGGTGSGKTTFAKALVDIYPANRRLITIEEINELALPNHLNRVHLLYGDTVTPKQLVTSCMRMKADHIFLAELTGDETWDFMELLNTGHPGTITTAHANDALSGFARVCGLIKQSNVGLGLEYGYIERRVRSSFDAVLYMNSTYIEEVYYEPELKLALLNGGNLDAH